MVRLGGRGAAGLALALALAGAAPVAAHDYWLEPERFRLDTGEPLRVRLFVGDRLERQAERSLEADRTTRFERIDANGVADLLALPRRATRPVLDLPQRTEGPVLVAMDRSFASIELEAGKFREYLSHEGFEGLGLPDSATAFRERYARCLKTLVQAGDGRSAGLHDRRIGQRLELLLLSNPYLLAAGDTLGVELRFEGEPLAGHPLTVLVESSGGETSATSLRTDAAGRAWFAKPSARLVVVRTVHLSPCDGCVDADWESWWTSFSFGAGP